MTVSRGYNNNNDKYQATRNSLYLIVSRIALPVIHGWASLFGNYFAMTSREYLHGHIIAVFCAKPYKRGEYANGKNSDYIQRPTGGRSPASGRSDELEKPAYRAAQCEQCKGGGTHVPMSVDEAAEYLGIPKGTLYMKLSDGSIPATKPGKRYCLYRDELDRWLESSRKNPVPLSDEELSESMSSSHRRKPGQRNW